MTAISGSFRKKLQQATQSDAGRSYWDILVGSLFNFFNVILFSVGLILIAFGRHNDAFITVIAGLFSALIQTFQEVRAKRQLDRIALLVRPEATIVRNGAELTIDAAELAKGDHIRLRGGDQALADGVMMEGMAELDEALLTGESELVRKRPGDPIHSGSFCVSGDLLYQAEAVGADSAANKVTTLARTFTKSSTPLQRQITLAIRLLMVMALLMALLFYTGEFLRGSTLVQFVAGSAVLIGLVPYGLFLTISLAYTLGALRIAREGAILQHTQAVEILNYVDVLCLDKTGTLTTNALRLATVQPLGETTESELMALLGDFARSTADVNSTIQAIRRSAEGQQRRLVEEVRFASARRWSALAFAGEDSGASGWTGVLALGAPESLAPALTDGAAAGLLEQQIQTWSEQGFRVLLLAGSAEATTLRDGRGGPVLPPLQPLGLIGLSDELRPQAREILSQFNALGVRLKIISGDHPQTVAALARQLGVVEPRLVAGHELETMTAAEFAQAAEETTIFGRVSPEQKAQLVETLAGRGHCVAMIGDGINDILALKKSKLGIAMQSGSRATRNVADMILLNDTYAALAPALVESKRVINGLGNATYLMLTRSLSYAFVILGVLIVGLDFPFEPAQLGVTAITVGLPAVFLMLWARPQARQEPLLKSLLHFVLPAALWSMLVGVTLFAYVDLRLSAVFQDMVVPPMVRARFEQYTGLAYSVDQEFGLTVTRVMAQTTLTLFLSISAVLLILFLEPPQRWFAGWREVCPDRRPVWLVLGLLALLLVAFNVPEVAGYLGMIRPFPSLWFVTAAALLLWALGLRLFWRRRWLERLLALDG